ncbi:SHOCT domain-containing protein [Streptosporangium sp. NBC_01755]|uniref:SHOCT domain-containing protein n=1 Tax=unclassified Streptosporangium TaxID=2632669 RepID=UPI002DDAFC4E|nr:MULTISPECIES: SHOCT domain-containing protein [unclassified Streptosporangium]WSA26963.1 SHOCT domain-containing protein [Streptosporangium sp. NBC_01810]WSD01626.1 SHOCT domain-containing protein [Streptosporangium sp. NBC_01755]
MVRIIVLFFVIAVVVLCVLAMVRASSASKASKPAPENPREILRRRYAAGEIDEDEYLRRMSGLSQEW